MKIKQLIVLIVIAILLGGGAYFMNRSEDDTWEQKAADEAALLLPETSFDPTKVSSITIKKQDKTITVKKENGVWAVVERGGYPANLSNLKNFLMELTDCRVARKLDLSDAQRDELKLTETGATSVTLADDSGASLKTLQFGVSHTRDMGDAAPQNMMMMGGGGPMPDGRFIVDNGKAVLVSDTFSAVDSEVSYWLDKDFFKIGELKTAELKDGDTVLWSMSRNDKAAELTLAGDVPADKEIDTTKISSVKSAFSWMSFTDVTDAKPETIGMDKPKTFKAVDFDGFSFVISFSAETNGKRYLKLNSVTWQGDTVRKPAENEKPEDKAKLDEEFAKKIKEQQQKAADYTKNLTKWTYEVSSYSINNVDKTFADFLKDKPKPEPPKAEEKKDSK